MKRKVAVAACVAWAAAFLVAADARAVIDLATGLDGAGNLQFTGDALDANWQVTGAANPLNPPHAYVVAPGSADAAFFAWVANGPHSSWIAANPDDAFGNGFMTFTRTFDVSDPSTAAILYGAWAIDDLGTLSLNGHVLSVLFFADWPLEGGWTSMHRFSTVPADFVLGLNTLTMQVTTSDVAADGGRLEGLLIEGVSAIPELTSWAMIVIGFALVGLRLRRRGAIAA
jgi:hypothetical protein